jgi:transcriptional regulator with XRE-family HTH domain
MIRESFRLRPDEASAWRAWLADLGGMARRMRELLDLSQDQLARLAGISQGAVSRFEKGIGLSTPWVVAVKIRVALAIRIKQMDQAVLTDDARRFLEQTALYGLPADASMPPRVDDVMFLPAPELESVLRAFRRLPKEKRQAFASIATAVVEALTEDSTGS